MKIHSLKGMRDILPEEAKLWQFVEKKTKEVFETLGYEEIRTPILEETALFQKSIGEGTDIVNKEMYTLTDRGGRSLTLRPEGTAPIIRSYIENNLGGDGLAKLYYIGPMFRSERPQKGRSRQFHQIGVEVIGDSSPYIDISVIQEMAYFFKKLSLRNFKIKLCSLGCTDDKKKLARALRSYLKPEKSRLCEDCKVRLEKNVLRTLDCKVESCKALLRNSPKAKDFLCLSCSKHYNTVKDLLTKVGINFIEDPNMVRGLDYYTNTVFEVTHSALGAQDAIAAGGRYDNLVEDFGGRKTGAFGFAIGIERLLMALATEEKKTGKPFSPEIYLVLTTISDAMYAKAFKAMDELMKEGRLCDMNLQDKSLKAQMRQASKKGARFVAIFGDDELRRGEVVLRNMKTSEQCNVKLGELAKEVKKRL
jgi:histidyl-tRNA synthetase